MDLYPSLVFIHAASILLFFMLHGASMAVAFKLKQESDPDRVRALLDLSAQTLVPAFVLVAIGLLAGVLLGFIGDWWGELWIWVSLGIFLVVGFAMTPMAAGRLRAIRTAAGQAPPGRKGETPLVENPEEMQRLIQAWNPMPTAALGYGAFVVILWLMFFKPF